MGTVTSSQAVRNRTWPSTLAVAMILVAVVLGGYFTAALLATPQGRPVDVGGLVRVTPLSGWEVANEGKVGDIPTARLTRGNGNLDVFAVDSAGSDVELLRRYVDGFLKPEARELSVSEEIERIRLDSGLEAVRVNYLGAFGDLTVPIEGQVTATVSPSGAGVVFDGWASEGMYGFAAGDVDQMIAAAEVS